MLVRHWFTEGICLLRLWPINSEDSERSTPLRVSSHHVLSRWTRPYHGGYCQSRRARLATAVHVGHVDVASSSPGLGCSPVWMSVRPAMRSILYGSRSSSIKFGTDFAVNFLIYSYWPLLANVAIASCSWGGLSVQVMPVFLAGCFKFAKHLPQLWLCSS